MNSQFQASFQGGNSVRIVRVTDGLVSNARAIGFRVLETATFTTLNTSAGDASIKGLLASDVFSQDLDYFLPAGASDIELASGTIIVYEY